jgi:hypothetical protein
VTALKLYHENTKGFTGFVVDAISGLTPYGPFLKTAWEGAQSYCDNSLAGKSGRDLYLHVALDTLLSILENMDAFRAKFGSNKAAAAVAQTFNTPEVAKAIYMPLFTALKAAVVAVDSAPPSVTTDELLSRAHTAYVRSMANSLFSFLLKLPVNEALARAKAPNEMIEQLSKAAATSDKAKAYMKLNGAIDNWKAILTLAIDVPYKLLLEPVIKNGF